MLLSLPPPPFQDVQVISVLQMLAGKALNCMKLFGPSKSCGKKNTTLQTLCYVLYCWVNVEIALFHWTVKEKISRFSFCNEMWGGSCVCETCICASGKDFPPSPPHQWIYAAQQEHLMPGMGMGWDLLLCAGRAVACSDPSVSGTPCYKTLMNFNLDQQVWEANGMTQFEAHWIAYWLPILWFGIFLH